MGKSRLDHLLTSRGLAESRTQAKALILAGEVSLGGPLGGRRPTPGMLVRDDVEVHLKAKPRFVSRGGEKLSHALETFELDVADAVALDVGASTGGFTDCLLQRGAKKVYAVDVGYGQLDARLRADPRVIAMERTNAREGLSLEEPVDLITADVSFISLRLVLPPALEHLEADGSAVVLLKPQFEARRQEVGKGGVIRDPQLHAHIIGRFVRWATDGGLRVRGLTSSPVQGDAGNREFVLWLQKEAGKREDSSEAPRL